MKNLSQLTVVSIHTTTTDASQSTIRKTRQRYFVGTFYHDPVAQRYRIYSRVSPFYKNKYDAENFLMLWIDDYRDIAYIL